MAKIDNAPYEPDPFEKADSPAAIMAYVYSKAGEEGLRALLADIETDKETLERDAAELDAVGLPDVAIIVMEAAANLPDAGSECPFQEGTTRWRDWMRRNRGVFSGYQVKNDTHVCVSSRLTQLHASGCR